MQLDRGICTVLHKTPTHEPGYMPGFSYTILHKGWYGELSFETAPVYPTQNREEIHVDKRIRILQCQTINNHDTVVLADVAADADLSGLTVYEVTRAYHGWDEESAELITDLSLEVIRP